MTTLEILDRLQGDALKDGELRKKLLATRLEKDPLTEKTPRSWRGKMTSMSF